MIEPDGRLRPVDVQKRRVRYTVGGCTAEVTDVKVNGEPIRTIAIEAPDPSAVISSVRAMGLGGHVNTSYPRGLAAVLDQHPARFAVIDVGTNSVKFHIAELGDDTSWKKVVDRAEVPVSARVWINMGRSPGAVGAHREHDEGDARRGEAK